MTRRGKATERTWRAGLLLAALASLGLVACDAPATAPPFAIEGTGSIEGRLFLDESRDGMYDPAGGDTPIAGTQIVLYNRGTEQVLAGPVTTDAQGRFAFEGVRPGTHDLFVVPEEDDEGVVCRNPLPVSVYRNEPLAVAIAAQDACLITILEAREAGAGEFVNIRGVVTSTPGQVQSSYVYIQDATGGIQFFTSALNGAGLEIGDVIDVSGVLSEFNTTLQLESVVLNEVVPGVGAPDPAAVTTAEIAADGGDMTGSLQGTLVTVSAAELLTGFTSGGSRNANIDDGSGPTILRVASGVVSGSGDAILSELGLQVGNCYDITGLVGAFAGEGQLFPRSADDFEEVPCN